MTETEAKQKRCIGPSGTGTTINPATGVNMKDVIGDLCMPRWCIGTDCTGWQVTGTGKGYCGLAVKP